jgi:hypothetical protein
MSAGTNAVANIPGIEIDGEADIVGGAAATIGAGVELSPESVSEECPGNAGWISPDAAGCGSPFAGCGSPAAGWALLAAGCAAIGVFCPNNGAADANISVNRLTQSVFIFVPRSVSILISLLIV